MTAGICAGAERPFDFGLSGNVTITKATIWMDGGSVSISLRDEHGTEARAHYRNRMMYDEKQHGDQFSFRRPGATQPVYFARNSAGERSLFDLLRVASTTTFGTSDPKQLDTPGDWNRIAMSSLFRQIARRAAPISK